MAQKTKVELNTETTVELLVSMRDNDQKHFEKVAASIDALTLSISQLTTQQKATATNLEKWAERTEKSIEKLTEAIREQNQAIAGHLAVAQAQSANIAELTKLATAIVSRS